MDDTKALILAELDGLGAEELGRLYAAILKSKNGHGRPPEVAPQAAEPPPPKQGPGLLECLMEIRFEGPEDFSTNWERYAARDLGGRD